MIAESTPAIGETFDATAIPKASGSATRDTLNAADKSFRQFCLKPFSPVAGTPVVFIYRKLVDSLKFRRSLKTRIDKILFLVRSKER